MHARDGERYREVMIPFLLQGAYDLVESKRCANKLNIYAYIFQVSGYWHRYCVLWAF